MAAHLDEAPLVASKEGEVLADSEAQDRKVLLLTQRGKERDRDANAFVLAPCDPPQLDVLISSCRFPPKELVSVYKDARVRHTRRTASHEQLLAASPRSDHRVLHKRHRPKVSA